MWYCEKDLYFLRRNCVLMDSGLGNDIRRYEWY